jgi:hypothetical protein
MRLRFLLFVHFAGLRKFLFGFGRSPEFSEYDAEAVVSPGGAWVERYRAF